ncbi:MAG: glycine cleavage system protein H, partial [Candidatus Tectimicrobiota bacterium]
MDYPVELRYTEEHTWVARENGKGTIGITAYAQDQLEEVIYVELPVVGEKVEQMEPFGVVESVKAVSDLVSP